MPRYMVQASYSTHGITDLVKNPQDRSAALRPVIERLGGSLESFDFAMGDYDIVGIFQLPDNVSAVALAMAVGAAGSISAFKTTVLISMDEAVEAMRKAGTIGYRPPGG